MNNRTPAVYGRQSVDKKDSISIESQIEFCRYELKGECHREYTDKGYSGKNTERPKFQELIRDIEQGLISKVIVYKLDRISRSIIDFANMMVLFGRYNVEFVSATEKFDTSTPMGRAMLNICIVFAQLERETIQKRVQDAFYSRCKKGFFMSGQAPYGYILEPTVIDGINTKKMTADPQSADHVRLMYELYARPNTSLGDIIQYFAEHGINCGIELSRSQISSLLKNPVYAQADLELYEFFKDHGAEIVNDAIDFTGANGCYFYTGRGAAESKRASMKGHILVVAPHEGLVSSELWLACRRRLLSNTKIPSHKANTTWLAGKVKCGRCGAALLNNKNPSGVPYFRCRKRADTNGHGCKGCGTLRVREFEDFVYIEMRRKMAEFQTLTDGKTTRANPKLTALNVELAQVDAEIEKLLDNLAGANATLLHYANSKIEALDAKRQSLTKAIADMRTATISPEQARSISGYLGNWENVAFDDKRLVADSLICKINATNANVRIEWKF